MKYQFQIRRGVDCHARPHILHKVNSAPIHVHTYIVHLTSLNHFIICVKGALCPTVVLPPSTRLALYALLRSFPPRGLIVLARARSRSFVSSITDSVGILPSFIQAQIRKKERASGRWALHRGRQERHLVEAHSHGQKKEGKKEKCGKTVLSKRPFSECFAFSRMLDTCSI